MTRHKSPHGQGGVSRKPRKDGRYSASLVIDGKRYWRYARTKRAALDELAKLRLAAAEQRQPANERLTVAAYLADWLTGAEGRVKPSTYRRYADVVRLQLTPTIGQRRLAALRPADVRGVLAGSALGSGTQRTVHTILRMALGQAVREGLVSRNVASLVPPPRRPPPRGQALSAEQARALLEAVREERLAPLYVLLLTTACRVGELLGLRWVDLDLTAARLTVSGTLVRVKGKGLIHQSPKSGKARTVPLLPVAVEALRRRRTAQAEERLVCGPAWRDSGYVFTARSGLPLDQGHVRELSLYPLRARLGLSTLRLHDLRHSAATLLMAEGIPLPVVSRLLGHASVATTGDIYSHVDQTQLATAVAALGRLFAAG